MANYNLDALLDLQNADMRLRDLELRLTMIPKELDAILGRRDKLNASTAAAAEKVKKAELAIKNAESTIQSLNEESRKLQQQSALVKKNNEYQAMLAEIEKNKQKIGQIEEDLLIRFDEVEELKKTADAVKRSNAAELRSARAEFEELLGFSKTCKAEVEKIKASRPVLSAKVHPDLLSDYEQLLRGKNAGAPLVKVVDGCCEHCHMQITLQTLNQITKGELQRCDSCRHLLYIE